MFSKKELTRVERRKRTLVARNDLLRQECAQIWSAMEQRGQVVERRIRCGLRAVHPSVSIISTTALLYLKGRYLPEKKYLGPLFALAGLLVEFTRRPPAEEPYPDSHRLPDA